MTRTFVEEWVLNPRKKSVERKIDTVRGEYPYNMASGYWSWGAGSTGVTSLLTVPSGYVFNLKMLYIYNNDPSASAELYIYDGPGTSVPIFPVLVTSSSQLIIGEDKLKGVIFKSTVNVSTTTSLVTTRVGGFLYESD